MSYTPTTWVDGVTPVNAQNMNKIEEGIRQLDANKLETSALQGAIDSALSQAKASGAFKGDKGDKGDKGETGATGATGPTGPAGPTGATPNFSIGTVTTLNAGSSATATITGTAENPVLNLGIPKGKDGTNGTGGGGTGTDGVGIASVVQTTTSTADDGNNIITVTLTDGTSSTFTVQNGSKGSAGADGKTPVRGTDYWTAADIAEIKSYVDDAILGGAW